MGFSEIFWSSVVTTASGIMLACIALVYKSKCVKIDLLWGCIVVDRNIDIEMIEDLANMEGKQQNQSSPQFSTKIENDTNV